MGATELLPRSSVSADGRPSDAPRRPPPPSLEQPLATVAYCQLVQLRVLGPIEVFRGDRPVSVGGPQQRRLLAALVVERERGLSVDRLIEILWPSGDDGDAARHTAATYVARLRVALGAGLIVTTEMGYRLDTSGASLDADRFVSLTEQAREEPAARAVELYDEALSGWRGPVFGAIRDEWWAAGYADGLEQRRFEVIADRLEALSSFGWTSSIALEVGAAANAHPERERFVALAMSGLHATGRTAEALRVFHRHHRALAEVGLVPSPSLGRLEHAIASNSDLPKPLEGTGEQRMRGYVLHEQIGAGATAVVYRATQPEVTREVAVKAIRPDVADRQTFIRLFEAEARLASRLEHPNIVPLFDAWREPGRAFLIFRLMRGGSGVDWIAQSEQIDIGRVGLIAQQIGGAVAAAHRAGVVHRDIKPANVLFDEAGVAYLTDFGIAAAIGSEHLDDAVEMIDSRPYASPEVLDGRIADERADQYSFGCLLREMLKRSSTRPIEVDDVLAMATAGEPDDRYPDVEALVAAFQAAISRPAAAVREPPRNPYLGLRPFTDVDAASFFGRRRDIAALSELVDRRGFTLVVGASGSGKTSLVLAGLVPRLRAAGALVASVSLGVDPFTDLRTALSPLVREADASVLDSVRFSSAEGMVHALRAIGMGGRVVIVLDGFERLWTSVSDGSRAEFLAAIATAVEAEAVRVVGTIRADRYDLPLSDSRLGSLVASGTFTLVGMTAIDIHEAVVRPAELVGTSFEPGLAARLVSEVVDQPAGLPLLQFVLSQLFDQRDDDTIRSDALDHLGGLGGAISRHADALFDRCDTAGQAAIRRLFGRLVTVQPNGDVVARRARRADLVGVPSEIVDMFAENRLLSLGRESLTREQTVEIGHDDLLRAWPQLREWIDDDHAWLRQRQSIAAAAVLWESALHDEAELLGGARLSAAMEIDDARRSDLTTAEAHFVDASLERANEVQRIDAERLSHARSQNRRLRRSLLAAGLAIVALAVSGVVALHQRTLADRSRHEALIGDLSSRSLALRDSQRDVASLLAVEAWRRSSSSTAASALFGVVTADPEFVGFVEVPDASSLLGAAIPGTTASVVAAALSGRSGSELAVIDVGGESIVRQHLVDVGDDVVAIATSGDGQRVAVLAQDVDGRSVTVYLLNDGASVVAHVSVGDDVTKIAIDGSGSELAVASGSTGLVELFDLSTGDSIATIDPVEGVSPSVAGEDAGAVAYAPDGRLVVGSSGSTLRVFDDGSQLPVLSIDVPVLSTAGSLRFTADGSAFIAEGFDADPDNGFSLKGGVAKIDLAAATTEWALGSDRLGFGECVQIAVAPDGGRLWCANYFGIIRERSGATGELTGRQLQNQNGSTSALAVVGTTSLVAFSQNAGVLASWRIDGGGPLQRLVAPDLAFLSYAPHGSILVAQERGQPVDTGYQLIDATTGARLRSLDEFEFAASSEQVLYGLTPSGEIRVEAANPRSSHEFGTGRGDEPETLVTSVDGALIAVGYGDGTTDLFDVENERLIQSFGGPGSEGGPPFVFQAAIDAERSRLYVSGAGVWVYDLLSGTLLAHRDESSIFNVGAAAGNVVVAHVDGRLELVDRDTLVTTQSLTGARGLVEQLRFSRNGGHLLAAGNDGSVALYDIAESGRLLGDVVQFGGDTGVQIDMRLDGEQAAMAQRDGRGTILWDLEPEKWAAAACALAGRNLTREEWTTYLAPLGEFRATCPDLPVRG